MPRTVVSAGIVPIGSGARLRARFQGRVAPVVYAAVLAFWASSWNLRLSVLMAWMPVEPVWIASFAVALCVVHRCGRELRIAPAVAWPLALLVLGFVPGALETSGEGYGPTKLTTMILVVLPVVVAATVLLDSPPARQAWLGAQVLVGGSVAIASLTTSHVSFTQPGRFTLATVDTISTGRMVGVASVLLVLLAMTSWQRAWWAIPLAGGCVAVLVQVGSRGPLLFMMISVLVIVLAGRCFAGRRVALAGGTAVVAAGAYRYAVADGGSGGQRILSEGLSDTTRTRLLSDALHAGLSHPFGVGWGDFAESSKTAGGIANAHGASYAHDAFAEAFSEGGWSALLVFTVLVGVAMIRLWRLSDQPHMAILWASVLYWVLNALVSLDFTGNRVMWISLACALATFDRGNPDHGSEQSA